MNGVITLSIETHRGVQVKLSMPQNSCHDAVAQFESLACDLVAYLTRELKRGQEES